MSRRITYHEREVRERVEMFSWSGVQRGKGRKGGSAIIVVRGKTVPVTKLCHSRVTERGRSITPERPFIKFHVGQFDFGPLGEKERATRERNDLVGRCLSFHRCLPRPPKIAPQQPMRDAIKRQDFYKLLGFVLCDDVSCRGPGVHTKKKKRGRQASPLSSWHCRRCHRRRLRLRCAHAPPLPNHAAAE
jgi:hypothetical protein